jgi:hypothetical protein
MPTLANSGHETFAQALARGSQGDLQRIKEMASRNRESRAKPESTVVQIDPNPRGEMKDVAGADHDEWNIRQVNLVFAALPGEWDDKDSTAVVSGMVDMKPADPVEGVLIGQLIAANDAAMKLYRLGWINLQSIYTPQLNIYDAHRFNADRTARPPPRPRASTDRREAHHHRQCRSGSDH